MSAEISIKLEATEGPAFLPQVFLEREADGAICIGVLKDNGSVYAYSRITPEDLQRYVEILLK